MLKVNEFLREKDVDFDSKEICPVSWGGRIHRLHLCSGVRLLTNVCSVYDTKQSDGEASVSLEIWGMRSTPLLPLLPGPLRGLSNSIC